jgi:hypothetical protein
MVDASGYVGEAERRNGAQPARAPMVFGLIATTVLALAYAFGVLIPFYVNDLDSLPLTEVAGGAYDPKEMWPSTSGYGGALLRTSGVLAMWLMLPVHVPVAVAALVHLVSRRSVGLGQLRLSLFILAVSVASIAVQLSPFGRALYLWALD